MVAVLELGRAVTAHSKTERRLISQEHLVEVTTHLDMLPHERNLVSENRKDQKYVCLLQRK